LQKCYVPAVFVLAVALLSGTAGCGRGAAVSSSAGTGADGNRQQTASLPTVLAVPVWKTGDWFEIKMSHWMGGIVAGPAEKTDWSPPVIVHYAVIGEEPLFGYPCFVLSETWPNGDTRTETRRYLFRKSDMLLLCVRTLVTRPHREMKWVEQYGQSPWIADFLGLAPRFPVGEGRKVIPHSSLLDASGKRVGHRSEAEIWERPIEKSQQAIHDNMTQLKNTNNLIQIEYENYVCRWKPGQIWWAQCWEESAVKGGNGGAEYRAALYATSQDGVLDYPLPAAAKGGIIQEQKVSAPAEP
jgi:hypothetical protein